MSFLLKEIEKNESLAFSFENQFKRFTYITFLPTQCNTSTNKMDDGKINVWLQLTAIYKKEYASVLENGEIEDGDNATQNILFIKFSDKLLKGSGYTITQLRDFFNSNFIGKKFLSLPVTEETPVYDIKNNIRNLVKNQTQCFVVYDFDLKGFIESYNKNTPKFQK